MSQISPRLRYTNTSDRHDKMQVFDSIVMRRQRKRRMMRETESPVAGNGNEFMNLKNDLM